MSESNKRDYYYAGNEQIELEAESDYVAFDLSDIEKPTAAFKSFVEKFAESLRRSVYLVATDDCTQEALKVIEENDAARPVFRSGDNVIVVLPEIRVEDDKHPNDLEKRIKRWVEEHKDIAETNEDKRGRMVVQPKVKSGNDALQIARSLVEELKVESAQPRMVQKIRAPRPSR